MAEFFFKELADYPGVNNLTVILMGIGVVFAGLIGLIIVCTIMGKICAAAFKTKAAENAAPVAAPAPASQASADGIADRGAFIAAVSAAIAEASGTDAAGLRIVKIEKLN
jgi:sodium pump decarboxylase gamma subunit